MLEMVDLELVAKGKLGNLLLHLGELVIVLRDPLQDVLDELALRVTDGDGELEVAEDDLALQEEYLALETVPFVKVLLADLVQVVHGGDLLGDGGDLFGDCGNLLGDGALLLGPLNIKSFFFYCPYGPLRTRMDVNVTIQ